MHNAGIVGGLDMVECQPGMTGDYEQSAHLPNVLHALLIPQKASAPYETLPVDAGCASACPLDLALDLLDGPLVVDLYLE